jgi:hypothetical protein
MAHDSTALVAIRLCHADAVTRPPPPIVRQSLRSGPDGRREYGTAWRGYLPVLTSRTSLLTSARNISSSS